MTMAEMGKENYQTSNLYEKEVQVFLSENLNLIGPLLRLVKIEHPVKFGQDVGRIDVLAKHADGTLVVIEVKRGIASRGALGQLQSYMGVVSAENPHTKVIGILVAMDIDEGCRAALRVTAGIEFIQFKTIFQFQRVLLETPPRLTPSVGEAEVRQDYWEKLGGEILSEATQCRKCSCASRVVRIGAQKVCGMCGHPIT